jgi:hypothetical protein
MYLNTILRFATLPAVVFSTPADPALSQSDGVSYDDVAKSSAADPKPWGFGLFICPEPHWGGECIYGEPYTVNHPNSIADCVLLPFTDHDLISLGPDGGITCWLYSDWECTDHELKMEYPGFDSLATVGHGQMGYQSYRCLKNWGRIYKPASDMVE